MALYYFNFFNDVDTIADEGVDLPDLAHAEEEARRGAATMIAEHILNGQSIDPAHRIEVQDDKRRTVYVLRFSDLIRIP